jgi:hypothetical protein
VFLKEAVYVSVSAGSVMTELKRKFLMMEHEMAGLG